MCNERFFFFNAPPTTPIYTLSLHDALPISILPLTGLPALHCYGVVEESEGEFCWLFLEDAAGVRYSPQLSQHRELAACWLAKTQLAAASTGLEACLPARELDHYPGLPPGSRNESAYHLV